MLPGVKIKISNGNLGRTAPDDFGVSGIVITGSTAGGITVGKMYKVYSLQEAETLGFNSHPSTPNHLGWKKIKEFYDGYAYATGGNTRCELYIHVVALTVYLADYALNELTKFLDWAGGRVRLLGISILRSGIYSPSIVQGVDEQISEMIYALPSIIDSFVAKNMPFRAIVGVPVKAATAALWQSQLIDNFFVDHPGILVSAWNTSEDYGDMALYHTGVYAGLQIQRSAARVKNGPLPFDKLYIGGQEVSTIPDAVLDSLHQPHNISFVRKFPSRPGFYFADDNTTSEPTNDYYLLPRGRVIDAAQIIAYDTFLEELNDDVEVDAQGRLPEGYLAYLKERITSAIVNKIGYAISGTPIVDINPDQNIIATDKLTVTLKIIPKGYTKYIEVNLGFTNPSA